MRGGLSIGGPLETGLIMYLLLNGCEEVWMPPYDRASECQGDGGEGRERVVRREEGGGG